MNRNAWLAKAAFFVYLLLLVWIVIFKTNFSLEDIHMVREVNLIPFHYENVFEGDFPLFEALLNILVFVPFGFLLHKAFHGHVLREALLVVSLSLSFEITQYVLSIGASDITDLITNTLGGVVGIALAVLIAKRSVL